MKGLTQISLSFLFIDATINHMDKTVLCYIEQDNKYLLIYRNKKKNDLNEGKYLGIGGHIEPGESKEEAVVREVKEETGLTLLSFKYRGLVHFKDDDYQENMYLFTSHEFEGTLKECDEGELHWIDKDKVLDLPCWEGDKYFLSELIKDNPPFEMSLIYKNKKLAEYY